MDKFLEHLKALSDQLGKQIATSENALAPAKTELEININNIFELALRPAPIDPADKKLSIKDKLEKYSGYLPEEIKNLYAIWKEYPASKTLEELRASFRENLTAPSDKDSPSDMFVAMDKGNTNPKTSYVEAINNINSSFKKIDSIKPISKDQDETYINLRNYSQKEQLQLLKTDIDKLQTAFVKKDFVTAKKILIFYLPISLTCHYFKVTLEKTIKKLAKIY